MRYSIHDFLKDLQKLPLDTACFMGAHTNQKGEWVVSISSTHGKGSLFRNPLYELLHRYGARFEEILETSIIAYVRS